MQSDQAGRVFRLPDASWSRRVAGVFANQLAREEPDLAHGLLIEVAGGVFQVSVRAPLNRRRGADRLCRRYPTGGGRAAAAGINRLAPDQVDRFLADFSAFFTDLEKKT